MGYTQQQVAEFIGITKSTYCGYETGKRKPDVEKIKILSKVLQTSGDSILETGFEKEQSLKLAGGRLQLIIDYYNQMDDAGKDALMEQAEFLFGKHKIETQGKNTQERRKTS